MLKTDSGDPTKPKEKFFTKKKVVRWVATSSVRFVVVSTVNTIVPADTKIKKIKRYIGSQILAEMVAEKVREYIDTQFDEVVEDLKEAKDVAEGIVEGVVVSSTIVSPEDEILDAEIVEDPPVTSNA